jgi:hypothetical protein
MDKERVTALKDIKQTIIHGGDLVKIRLVCYYHSGLISHGWRCGVVPGLRYSSTAKYIHVAISV